MNEQVSKPDWNILINFGLPLNSRQKMDKSPDYSEVVHHIVLAADYLLHHSQARRNGRYFDSFKALLLSLKIHYPSEFRKIELAAGTDLTKIFKLTVLPAGI